MIRAFIKSQVYLSKLFDSLLPTIFNIDGNQDFQTNRVKPYLEPDSKIFDIGGGKNPYLNADKKKNLRVHVTGLDLDLEELEQAPAGLYDDIIASDITKYEGSELADIAICRTVLEHVPDNNMALSSLSRLLKTNGIALIFVPNKLAVFALLNRLLPEHLKKKLLYAIYPSTEQDQGFKAYYDRCTPKEFRALAAEHSLEVMEEKQYYISQYFTFFFPLHLCWRVWSFVHYLVNKENACETFFVALKKIDD